MYFPLLRAKQFELLALREVASLIAHKPISPVIEPTKADTTQLTKAITSLISAQINFSLVLNSCITNSGCLGSISDLINSFSNTYKNFQIGINIDHKTDFDELWKYLEVNNLQDHNLALIHLNKPDNMQKMEDFIKHYNVKYNILHIENVKIRYKRNFDAESCISLNDSFNQQQRNADYVNIPDEPFSEEFLYYKDEGFKGFADYLTIGQAFSESGFTPYVVVIHLTYLKSKEIRIAHFASTTNKDTNSPLDLPKKFKEALSQLTAFVGAHEINETKAIDEFKNLQLREHFPGLGSVKKLSIMNHLELVSNLL
ncbi:sce7725 family protein [Spirosoma aerophilum]